MSSISNCRIIDIPKVVSMRGALSFLESENIIPFEIRRVYYTYDIPSGAERGGHAHKELFQLIIPVSGSFNVLIDDGNQKDTVFLNSPDKALLITPGIWRELNNFSTGSVVLVLASAEYDEADYLRNYSDFIENYA